MDTLHLCPPALSCCTNELHSHARARRSRAGAWGTGQRGTARSRLWSVTWSPRSWREAGQRCPPEDLLDSVFSGAEEDAGTSHHLLVSHVGPNGRRLDVCPTSVGHTWIFPKDRSSVSQRRGHVLLLVQSGAPTCLEPRATPGCWLTRRAADPPSGRRRSANVHRFTRRQINVSVQPFISRFARTVFQFEEKKFKNILKRSPLQ